MLKQMFVLLIFMSNSYLCLQLQPEVGRPQDGLMGGDKFTVRSMWEVENMERFEIHYKGRRSGRKRLNHILLITTMLTVFACIAALLETPSFPNLAATLGSTSVLLTITSSKGGE
jgi:hypothetical protein